MTGFRHIGSTLIFLTALLYGPQGHGQQPADNLRTHVYYLAGDSLLGRDAGSPQAEEAALYIAREFDQIGLSPVDSDSFLHPFQANKLDCINVVGAIPGTVWKDEYIIIGAHYDHLGFRRNAKGDTIIYNGADDNASGTAILIETARELMKIKETLKTTIIFAAFDAEEKGLHGSAELAEKIPAQKIRAMFSIDMAGWMKGGPLYVKGSGFLENSASLLASDDESFQVKLEKRLNSMFTASDYLPFLKKGIPAMLVTTGLKSPYHKPEDTAEKIDIDGMVQITKYMTSVTYRLSNTKDLNPAGKALRNTGYRKEMPFIAGITGSVGSSFSNTIESKVGFSGNIGGFIQFNFPYVALRARVLYDGRGLAWNNIYTNSSYNYTLHELMIPLDIMFSYTGDWNYNSYFNLGGYYRHKLATGNRIQNPLPSGMRMGEWGLQVGYGYYFGKLWMEAAVYLGVTDQTQYNDGVKSSSILFTVGYRLF